MTKPGRLPAKGNGPQGILYVMVAGPGGSGKSPFIKEALGPSALQVPDVSSGPYPPAKSDITAFEVPAGVIGGPPHNHRVVLVEVPALRMGTPTNDIQIMLSAVAWLKVRNAKAAGIVYLNETNPNKYGIGSMDAKDQLPRLRSWFESLLNPEHISTVKTNSNHRDLNVVVGIVDYRANFESALREHWAPIVTDANTTEPARRLVLGADHPQWTAESARRVLQLLELHLCEGNGGASSGSSSLGVSSARPKTPEPTGNCFERLFGWCC